MEKGDGQCGCGVRGAGLSRARSLGRAAAGEMSPVCPVLRHLIPFGDSDRSPGIVNCVLNVSR